jgi:hypothetical protein
VAFYIILKSNNPIPYEVALQINETNNAIAYLTLRNAIIMSDSISVTDSSPMT